MSDPQDPSTPPARSPSDPAGAPPSGGAGPFPPNGGQPGYQPPTWAPPGQGYGYGYGPPVAPPDIEQAQRSGKRAAIAILVGLVMYLAQLVASLIVIPTVRDTFEQVLDDIEAGRTTSTVATPTDPAYVAANLVSNLGSLVLLAVAIFFLVWVHRAVTNARALGLAQTHSPGWGVAGFIVPIINFWFPYQSMRDLFPPDHPGRKLAGRWFACWLGASFVSLAMTISAFFAIGVAIAIGVVVAGLFVVAAITIRSIITLSTELHTEIAAQQGWPTGPVPRFVPAPGYGAAPYGGQPQGPAPQGPQGPPQGWVTPPPAVPPKDPWNRN